MKKKVGAKKTAKRTTSKPAKAARPAAKAAPRPAVKAAARKPPKSPLGKREMEPYRKMLLELKQALLKEVLLNQEASNETNEGDVLDLADQASDAYDKDLANSLSEAERSRLNAVEAALKRVEKGSYGLCDSCEKPIPIARLRVLPFARCCVQCQQAEERGQKPALAD